MIRILSSCCLILALQIAFLHATGQPASILTDTTSSPKKIVIKYGIASYYAEKFNGRKTATGEIYNSGVLSAACNQLPLGTWVKVTNLRNEKSVVVRINDRLHPKNSRLIDLSRVAAKQLGYIGSGLTRVKVEVLGKLKKQVQKELKAAN